MLGDLMARLDQPGTTEAALLEAGELALLAGVADAAARLGWSTGDFALLAVRRFVDRAEDEDWTRLAGVMSQSRDPGLAALREILARAVSDVREIAPPGPGPSEPGAGRITV